MLAMFEVLLFHHALGLTGDVRAFADALHGAGQVVHAPDLFEDRTFERLADGIAYAEQLGPQEVIARGARAAAALPHELVYVGISLGVLPAQALVQTRAGARGAILVSSCVPAAMLGGAWPADLPGQIHMMARDPIALADGDLDAARALAASARAVELILYEGDAHLFVDDARFVQRAIEFVTRAGARSRS
jgi:dienelactone hydrolase